MLNNNNNNNEEIIKCIEDLKKCLQNPAFECKYIIAGTNYISMTKKQIFQLKEEYVKQNHKNKISEVQLNQKNHTYTVYQTRLPDNKRPRKRDYESLIEFLYDYYTGTTTSDYSVKRVFELALENKERTESVSDLTILAYKNDFKYFITDEFSSTDIRDISSTDLQAYIKTFLDTHVVKIKRYVRFKTLLNLIFKYAYEHSFISTDNIVPTSNTIFQRLIQSECKEPELKAFQPEEVEQIREVLYERIKNHEYDINAYALLFSSYSGSRIGEIPSLKWNDIKWDNNVIHIHSQQGITYKNGHKEHYYNPTTKNEKGYSRNGRYVPMPAPLKLLFEELKAKQAELGIDSEYVFARKDSTWCTTTQFERALLRLCKGDNRTNNKGLNLNLSNNHAFRMYYASYVLGSPELALPLAERARIMGHSVETHIRNYSHARAYNNEYLNSITEKMDSYFNNFAM